MDLRGAQRAAELGGDELVALAHGDEREHLGLPRRELPLARRRQNARTEVARGRAPDHELCRGLAPDGDRRRLEARRRPFRELAGEVAAEFRV